MTEQRRERPVPCRGSTLQESIRGQHFTWNVSAICDRCLAARAVCRLAVSDPSGSAPAHPLGSTSAPYLLQESAVHRQPRSDGSRLPVPSLPDSSQVQP